MAVEATFGEGILLGGIKHQLPPTLLQVALIELLWTVRVVILKRENCFSLVFVQIDSLAISAQRKQEQDRQSILLQLL